MSADIIRRDHDLLLEIARAKLDRRPTRIESLPAGMGRRRFHRMFFETGQPASMVARIEDDGAVSSTAAAITGPPATRPRPPVPDAPTWLPEPPLEPLRSFLETAGVPVPRSFLHLPESGIDLLEDVGDETLGDARGPTRDALYLKACEIIVRLQQLHAEPSRIPAFARVFDRALIETKLWKWLNWTIPLLLDRPASAQEISGTQRLFHRLGDLVEAAPRRLSHRDYKAENLHLRAPDGLVLIDVQGAFLAPPEYDLVCLLYDLQVDLDETFVAGAFQSTCRNLPDRTDPEHAQRRFDALAIARLCKDISHVVHAGRVGGDLRRWHEIPRGLELLGRAAERLIDPFPEIQTLTSVIQALTPRVLTADSGARG